MTLTQEEINELKTQLSQQIQHLPDEQKSEAQKQIDSMSPEALESMIKQQNSQPQIFRKIINKEIPSIQIGENSEAIAVLSTKSISKGHTIIVPKSQITEELKIPVKIHELSEEISKKLINSLEAKSTSIIPERSFGEIIINIIPIYNSLLSLKSPRQDISVEDLEKLKTQINLIKIEKKSEKIKIPKKRKPRPLKLKKRIP
jgi:hypothetical protein